MVDVSSLTTISTHFRLGSFNFCTCFFTMASKARSGVKRPVLHGRGRVGGSNEEEESKAEKEQEGGGKRRKEKGKERKHKAKWEVIFWFIPLVYWTRWALLWGLCTAKYQESLQANGSGKGEWGRSSWASEMVSCQEQDEWMEPPRDQVISSWRKASLDFKTKLLATVSHCLSS